MQCTSWRHFSTFNHKITVQSLYVFITVIQVATNSISSQREQKLALNIEHGNKWWRNKEQVTEIRGVKYRDEDLSVEVSDKNEEAIVYGNATVSENMSEALKMNPKFMSFSQINIKDMDAEIEKGLMKGRYQLMNKDSSEESEEDKEDDSDEKKEVFDLESKVMDYGTQCPKLHSSRLHFGK